MKPFVAILAALLAAPALFAQTNPTGTIPVLMRTWKVKPGHVSTFEDVIRKYRDAFAKDNRQFYMVWRVMMGDSYEFVTMSHVPGLEMFDAPSILAQTYGERGLADLNARMAICIDGMESQLWHMHPEQSVVTASEFRYAQATLVPLRGSSSTQEEGNDQRKIADGLRAAGWKNFFTFHLDYGGDDYMALYLTPVTKMSELRQIPGLSKTLGAEESRRILAAREQRRRSRLPYIWQYRPELSFRRVAGEASGAAPAVSSADTKVLRERLAGTWRLNPDKSPGANVAVSQFDRDGAYLRNTNGPINYKFKIDGKEHATPGNAQFDTVVWRKTGPRRYEHETRKEGKTVYTVVTEVAADGQTRSYRHTRMLAGGNTAVLDGVQERVGGESDPRNPIVGHWRLRQETHWHTADGDRMQYKAGTVSYAAAFDGTDHPVTGSTTTNTVSVRATGADSWETTGNKDGKQVFRNSAKLSADGKTITIKASRGDVVLEKVN